MADLLSDRLREFREVFVTNYGETGVEFRPNAVHSLSGLFLTFEVEARALEAAIRNSVPKPGAAMTQLAETAKAIDELAEGMAARLREFAEEERRVIPFPVRRPTTGGAA